MLFIGKENAQYALDKNAAPAGRINPGESVQFETMDCYCNNLLPEGNTFANVDRRFGNPATGPVYVNGAEPGDTLKITVNRIEVGPVGILDIGPTSGALAGIFEEPVINRIPVIDNMIHYDGRLEVPAKPMIGVIGTAPAGDAVSTKAPMDHGGNMDCTKIEEGSVLYLPVFAEGGLVSVGDLHAIMGEGEVANCGLEIEGKVTLTIDLLKQTEIAYPMLENEKQWITIAYGDTLDEASEKAVKQMFAFLQIKQELSPVDAGMLIDMAGDLIVCQIVNPYKTARLEVPKWMIKKLR